MTRRALSIALWFALLSAAASGCSGHSVVIGGDPFGEAGQPSSGGALPGGGFSGSSSSGDSGFGGGSLGGTGGQSAAGGAGGLFDPYPLVAYEGGQGYRHSCPHYDEVWGFTCWNFADGPRSCKPSGDPYCNACSCAVPCEDGTDACPPGVTGHPAICVSSATTMRSCFLGCSDGNCPAGMTCSRYPGAERQVCVWVSEPGPPP
jgi:hypothetical protein